MSRRMAFLHLPPIRWLTSFYNPPRKEGSLTSKLNYMTDWKSVKLLTFHSMIGELVSPSVNYVGIILIPSLNVELPLANYTNDKVYTFGAGMLKPEKISSNKLLVIGAHNLGWKGTSALFTPLAFHRLKGREVFITNFQVVKEYRITSKQIISPFDVQAPFRGKK